jgi:serine/threonine protein kinase
MERWTRCLGTHTHTLLPLLSQAAKYPLKAGRTPEYVAFLKKLLCPDVASRYTAAQALKDPWLMCDDWTAEMAQEAVASFQGELPAVVPGYYASRYAWLAKVDELTGVEEGTPPEPDSSDDEEAAM